MPNDTDVFIAHHGPLSAFVATMDFSLARIEFRRATGVDHELYEAQSLGLRMGLYEHDLVNDRGIEFTEHQAQIGLRCDRFPIADDICKAFRRTSAVYLAAMINSAFSLPTMAVDNLQSLLFRST